MTEENLPFAKINFREINRTFFQKTQISFFYLKIDLSFIVFFRICKKKRVKKMGKEINCPSVEEYL